MGTPARIALHRAGEGNVRIEEVVLPDPEAHQVLVRLESSGVCRSQLREIQLHDAGAPLPMGHEGLGVVEAVGAGVTELAIGDRVIVSWVPLAGEGIRDRDDVSVPLDGEGKTHPTTVFTWATHTLADEQFVMPVAAEDRDPSLALVGCALITGLGSAVYAGRAGLGDDVVVIGAGGVGLAAIVGARIAGAAQILVIDVDDEKLEFAKGFGATRTVNSRVEDPVAVVRSSMQRLGFSGADLVIDCVGIDSTLSQAVDCARGARLGAGVGGTVVVAGLGGGRMSVPSADFLLDQKSIVGTLAGGMGRHEILQVMRSIRRGHIDVSAMVTDRFSLDELPDAIERLRRGEILGRAILVY